ncbi:hypothetical protein CDL60_28540 [Roseateles noduli]|nr:hypothetical protein CDL60_28540 [Roseateles noduli]
MIYFLTIKSGDEVLQDRTPFADYAEAIAACGEFYEPKTAGASLEFISVVKGKRFMRSYSHLTRLEDLGEVPAGTQQAIVATKQGNAFKFLKSYTFFIESEEGIADLEKFLNDDDDEE